MTARIRAAVAATLTLACVALAAAPAAADTIPPFDVSLAAALTGPQALEAGGHPDLFTQIAIVGPSDPFHANKHDIRDVVVDLPPGMIGDPSALPTCTSAQLGNFACPPGSQIGTATLDVLSFFDNWAFPVYNLRRRNDEETARFGFKVAFTQAIASLPARIRSESDYGIQVALQGMTRQEGIRRIALNIWGVPGDPVHDPLRIRAADGCDMSAPEFCTLEPHPGIAQNPYLVNPTSCGTPMTVRMQATSYQEPDAAPLERTASLGTLSGCESVPFDPDVSVQPASRQAGGPTGLDVRVQVPQYENPAGVAASHLRRVDMLLPEGLVTNPSSVDGLVACNDAALKIGTPDKAACPDGSSLGTVEIDVPVLDGTLHGSVHLRPQQPGDLLRLALVADGFGVHAKIPGRVIPDPATGRLLAVFDNTPQVPFEELRVRFRGGPRAPLSLPPACGTYTTQTKLTSWSSSTPVTLDDAFVVDQGCHDPGQFNPSFSAGAVTARAGAASPFTVTFGRTDADQLLSGIDVTLPPGMLAKIAGIPLCGDSEAAAGTCADASRIGTTTTGAGAGTNPFFLGGKVYLTGPYKGGPYGLSIVVPAIAGPFDLGTVVVRAAIHVDPHDAHLRVLSDPLPTILQGIPLQLRTINVVIDRPDTTRNPSNCDAMGVGAAIRSTVGKIAQANVPFQVGDCAALPFEPSLKLRLKDRTQRREGGHPGLQATLTQAPGQARIKSARVTLPLSLALDPDNAESLCEYKDGLAVRCPESSVIGSAKAVSPLLPHPLVAKVYFVKGVRFNKQGNPIRTLPTLLIPLRGDIAIDLRATTSVKRNKLVTTFPAVPDAEISRFDLTLEGGANGVLVVTRKSGLCGKRQFSNVATGAHNGDDYGFTSRITTPCGKKAKAAKHRR